MRGSPSASTDRVCRRPDRPAGCARARARRFAERYASPRLYVLEAARTLPFVFASQIRRSSHFVAWPMIALMLATCGRRAEPARGAAVDARHCASRGATRATAMNVIRQLVASLVLAIAVAAPMAQTSPTPPTASDAEIRQDPRRPDRHAAAERRHRGRRHRADRPAHRRVWEAGPPTTRARSMATRSSRSARSPRSSRRCCWPTRSSAGSGADRSGREVPAGTR